MRLLKPYNKKEPMEVFDQVCLRQTGPLCSGLEFLKGSWKISFLRLPKILSKSQVPGTEKI